MKNLQLSQKELKNIRLSLIPRISTLSKQIEDLEKYIDWWKNQERLKKVKYLKSHQNEHSSSLKELNNKRKELEDLYRKLL